MNILYIFFTLVIVSIFYFFIYLDIYKLVFDEEKQKLVKHQFSSVIKLFLFYIIHVINIILITRLFNSVALLTFLITLIITTMLFTFFMSSTIVKSLRLGALVNLVLVNLIVTSVSILLTGGKLEL